MKTRVTIPVKFSKGQVKWADVRGAGAGCVKVIQEMAAHATIVELGPETESMHLPVEVQVDQTVET